MTTNPSPEDRAVYAERTLHTLTRLLTENAALVAQLHACHDENDGLRREVSARGQVIDDLHAKLHEAERQLAQARSDRDHQADTVGRLRRERDHHIGVADQRREVILERDATIDQLRGQQTPGGPPHFPSDGATATYLASEVGRIRRERDEANASIAKLGEALDDATKIAAAAQADTRRERDRVAELRRQVLAVHERNESLQARVRELEGHAAGDPLTEWTMGSWVTSPYLVGSWRLGDSLIPNEVLLYGGRSTNPFRMAVHMAVSVGDLPTWSFHQTDPPGDSPWWPTPNAGPFHVLGDTVARDADGRRWPTEETMVADLERVAGQDDAI